MREKDAERFGERHDDIKLGWGNKYLKASGPVTTTLVILAAAGALLIWHHFESQKWAVAMIEEMRNMSFILTLNEQERKSLNLQVPDSLRDRMEGDTRNRRR